MSQRNSGYARKPDEAYDSPPWLARVIAPYLFGVQTIWEPAPGKGQLSGAFRELGFDVIETHEDFFTLSEPTADAIVTNPPFGVQGKMAAMFARRALKCRGIRMVALLMRVDYDSAKTRVDIFRDCSGFAGKVILLDRIKWFPGESGPSDNHAWYVWDRKHRGSPWIEYQTAECTK